MGGDGARLGEHVALHQQLRLLNQRPRLRRCSLDQRPQAENCIWKQPQFPLGGGRVARTSGERRRQWNEEAQRLLVTVRRGKVPEDQRRHGIGPLAVHALPALTQDSRAAVARHAVADGAVAGGAVRSIGTAATIEANADPTPAHAAAVAPRHLRSCAF